MSFFYEVRRTMFNIHLINHLSVKNNIPNGHNNFGYALRGENVSSVNTAHRRTVPLLA